MYQFAIHRRRRKERKQRDVRKLIKCKEPLFDNSSSRSNVRCVQLPTRRSQVLFNARSEAKQRRRAVFDDVISIDSGIFKVLQPISLIRELFHSPANEVVHRGKKKQLVLNSYVCSSGLVDSTEIEKNVLVANCFDGFPSSACYIASLHISFTNAQSNSPRGINCPERYGPMQKIYFSSGSLVDVVYV